MGYKTYSCPIEKKCGGCEWLAVPYAHQLKRKQSYIHDLFKDVIRHDHTELRNILGMKDPIHYRHKAATPFAADQRGHILSGFYARGTHRIIACEECFVEDHKLRKLLNHVARTAERLNIPAYNEDKDTGLLRHAIVRSALYTDEILLTLVTRETELPRKNRFIKELLHGPIRPSAIVQNINTLKTNAMLGTTNITLHGDGYMHDKILGTTFTIGATSFYQTNPLQTEVLYKTAIDLADLRPDSVLLDAYCGCGTIGIVAATQKPGVKVLGIERNKEAVELASKNAALNDVSENCHFVKADATDYMQRNVQALESINALIMDPPRAGSTEIFLEAANSLAINKIVYVSCNADTLARDVHYLRRLNWKVDTIVPVDMFPHTKHVETVCLMTRAK